MSRKLSRKVRETRSSSSRKRSERDRKCWQRVRAVFLCMAHVLGLGGVDNSSSSVGATVHSLGALASGPGDTSKRSLFQPRRSGHMSCGWTTYGPDQATETYVRPRFPVFKEGGRTYVWKVGATVAPWPSSPVAP